MPGEDGFDLAAQIRQSDPIAATPMLMLTSAGQRGDGARCRKLGIQGYLMKPIQSAQLIDAIQLALGTTAPESTPPALITRHLLAEESPHWQILLADDNLVNQKVASRMLEKQGHSVTVASNGLEAIKKMEQQAFDLILMDIQMPEMDGFEATAAIRANELGGRRIPIIALTAHAMSGDRERCLAAGMDGYVCKPIRLPDVIAEINRVNQAMSLNPNREQLVPAAS
jgi:CheY-like chemotaxis protein